MLLGNRTLGVPLTNRTRAPMNCSPFPLSYHRSPCSADPLRSHRGRLESELTPLPPTYFRSNPKHEESYSPTPRDQIVEFRESVLLTIKNRGNLAACQEIQRLISALPHLPHLKTKLLEAEVIARNNTWAPHQPSDILQLVADKQRRLVQNGEQLLEVIIESLQRFQDQLRGETPAAIDLWNDWSVGRHEKAYRPKDEEDLSNRIKRHFDEDIKQKVAVLLKIMESMQE